MRLELDNESNTIHVTLSRRNLKALLDKLSWPSAGTIRFQRDGITLVVSSESDEVHYAGRLPGPMMNPRGELY